MTQRVFQSIAFIGVMVVSYAFWSGVRYALGLRRARQIRRARETDWDGLIASLKLRSPRDADFAIVEHQMWFSDDRNRLAAQEVFCKNGFTTSEAETYDRPPKYWLLAWRPVTFDNLHVEMGRVAELSKSLGGRYTNIGLREQR